MALGGGYITPRGGLFPSLGDSSPRKRLLVSDSSERACWHQEQPRAVRRHKAGWEEKGKGKPDVCGTATPSPK